MAALLSADEVATEAGVARERVEWLTRIGILKPQQPGSYRYGDVFRAELIEALLEAGFTVEQIERARTEGHLTLDHVDQYYPEEPDPPSGRTFTEFSSSTSFSGSS